MSATPGKGIQREGHADDQISGAGRAAGPPDHARAPQAVEHYAFCPDLGQDNDFAEYAAEIVDAPVWSFWWD
ncbi:DUF4253 domain-containing protein [Nonomuraea sp. NPDC049129]|uniref:DUF4253 domain-containing protein n=1 Tax=Nonomuraea sp. NPDC049129 TaxID=3155272 RepID=UPI0033E21F8A